uniref:Utrophin n=1 Tax=Oncorhynchus kisutch TaxID=8019 RepID=A0A8C7MMI6_ONCKI
MCICLSLPGLSLSPLSLCLFLSPSPVPAPDCLSLSPLSLCICLSLPGLSLSPLSISLSPVCLSLPCLSLSPLSFSLSPVFLSPVCLSLPCLYLSPLSVSLSPVCISLPCLSLSPLSISLSPVCLSPLSLCLYLSLSPLSLCLHLCLSPLSMCICLSPDIMKDIMSNLQQTNSEKILLSWVRQCTRSYQDHVNVLNFTTSWADGLAFNAILHRFRPNVLSWDRVLSLSPVERLDHAFTVAKDQLAIERLLDPEDVAVQLPDKKSIIMYVMSLFAVLPKDVTMEAIREVETLPRRYKVEPDESKPGFIAGSPRADTPSTLTETEEEVGMEVDLDSYQATLEEVLTWLLSAEDSLQVQEEVSDDVEEVKEQFHTHEDFMMELTAHQSSVGNVLQVGNQLISQGNLTEEEEDEIREQMTLLNSRWENIRVVSMDRQARLHEVLMDLQQQQLQQLSDWLTKTEERIRKMEIEPMAGDVEGYRAQIEQHKGLQNDLEAEQVKVNSLTHMVVVVDENSGESATAALEDQLQSLGERWAAVCRWTEERWHKLQDILLVWQQLLEDQSLFQAWLTEKEAALGEVQTNAFKDPGEMNANVRRLALLKEDMEKKRRTLDQLRDAGQDVRSLLRSAEAGARIEGDTEELTQRWDNLVQRLEDCSYQVTEAVTKAAGMAQIEERVAMETVVMETVAVAAAQPEKVLDDQELAPPTPPKRRLVETDESELRGGLESDLSDLLRWLNTWKVSAQTLASTDPENPDLQEKLQALEAQLLSKEAQVGQVTQGGRRLMEPLEKEGVSVDSIRCDIDVVEAEWEVCVSELKALCDWVQAQTRVRSLCSELAAVDKVLGEQDQWLSGTDSTRSDEAALRTLRTECKSRLAQLTALSPRLDQLSAEVESIDVPPTLTANMATVSAHQASTLQQLQTREQEINAGMGPQHCFNICSKSMQGLDPCSDNTALCIEIEQMQQASDPAELQRWSQLSSRAREELGTLQCILGSLKDNQVRVVEVERWLDGVQELMSRNAKGQGDAERLQEELNQCKEYVSEMESVESLVKQIGENVLAVQGAAVPELAHWGQAKLEECQGRWETLSKQLLSHQERVSESQERQVNLRKDLAEMQEWMAQVDEEFLMRDFEYKSPEELEGALEEMKRAKEDVLQKEVRVKILKDNINMLVAKAKTTPGGSGQDLTEELGGVLGNYQKLCDRFKSKCHTLEEVWSCWMELLQYLDLEQGWFNTLEEKLQATENLPESTEAVNKALESLECVLRHPGDNRTQIRELGQTLIDGGILDELISEKLETFNSCYDQLSHQAVNRQISLEQQLATLKENEQVLQALQESLTQLDHTLTSYLTDRIDAFQLPQEAQTIGAEIAAHEVTVEELRSRNVGNLPPATPEGKAARSGTMLDLLQRKLREISTKYQLFQKPANFEQRMLDCKRVLDGAKEELHILDVREVEPQQIQAHLIGCMKLYKVLSEVKLEVETVIKTGRQIVQKQQTDNPRGMDEQLTALKLLYNHLGAQVTEGKQDLEKALSLSLRLHKDSAALQDWLNTNQTLLQQKKSSGDMPADIDAEIAWANGMLKESEHRKADLAELMETSAGLQGLVEGSEGPLEDKLCGLNEGWGQVRTWTEDWLSTVLNHQNEVEIFDENLAHISTWLYQTQIHLDETERLPTVEREITLLEELDDITLRVDSVRDQAIILMTSRGPACRDVVEPKLAELNRNFHKVSQCIKAAKVQHCFTVLQSQLSRAMDEEKAGMEELLRRGEEVLLQTADEGQREGLRLRLLRLQAQYTTQRVRENDTQALSLSPSDYLLNINKVLLAMADNELLLNSSELSSGLYEDFSSQEDTLRSIKESLECVGEQVTVIHERQPDAILEASQREVAQIGDALTQLNAEWDRLNRMYNHRKGSFDRVVEEWRQFHCDLNDLSQWLIDIELVLTEGTGPDGQLDLDTARTHQEELEEGLASHMPVLAGLSQTGERIIGQLSAPDGPLMENKLEALGQRCRAVQRQVLDRQRRLAGGDPALSELVRRSGDLALWLEEAECAVSSLPVTATDKNLKELKTLAEEMDAQNERLGWMNKNGPQILANQSVSPQERDQHMSKLRTINLNWSKVTQELLDKVGEVEGNLQSHGQFQDKMNRMTDWVQVTHQSLSGRGVSPAESQVILTLSVVPSAVQMASLMSEDRHHQTPRSPELVAPTDLNETATELADWLLLITQMLKSNIVTVGDTDEIRTTMGRLQVTKSDLEQRHPQLEDIFTLAQNIKNKTSNLDVRTSITEKLEKVHSQWDNTQHGVEARLQQLDSMIGHSDQWEEQRLEVKALIGQNEGRLHNLLQLSREPLTKQLSDNKVFLQDLGRGQGTVVTFNELSNQLLREYSADDTRRIKEVTDKHNRAWNSINNRASDRQAQLDSDLTALQTSLRELEAFLKWLQEAETTVNVLADASQREELSQDSAHVKELRGQLEDIQAEIDAHNDIYKSVDGNRPRMVKALGTSEEAVFLQHRLDDMNQRWSDLKTKSANIRAHLEASAERWSRLLSLLEELWRWICLKDEDLAKQMPIGGDVPTLLQQHNHSMWLLYIITLPSCDSASGQG